MDVVITTANAGHSHPLPVAHLVPSPRLLWAAAPTGPRGSGGCELLPPRPDTLALQLMAQDTEQRGVHEWMKPFWDVLAVDGR